MTSSKFAVAAAAEIEGETCPTLLAGERRT